MNTKFTFNQYFMNFINKYSDKPWDWYRLSHNPNITFDIIEKYIDKPWDWNRLSCNPNIKFDIIEKYINKWNWDRLSNNPNITFDIIEKYNDKPWNWYYLSNNNFTLEKELFEKNRIINRNEIIKQELIENVFHPSKIQKLINNNIDYFDNY